MRTAVKLPAFGLVLAVVFAAAWTVGAAVGPLGQVPAPVPTGHTHPTGAPTPTPATLPSAELSGLSASANGYRLDVTSTTAPGTFRIIGPTGAPVTAFTVTADTRMRLIVTRLDTTGYQHLLPTMAGDGTWTAPVSLQAGANYRLIAEFTPEGGPRTILETIVHSGRPQ